MLDDAFKIFDFLPLRCNPSENEYMDHLWDAIKCLNSSTENARPFIMMPFHLLFMLAIQYKILRISKEVNSDYVKVFTIEKGRYRTTLISPNSVFDIALLEERTIPDIFKLIGLDQNKIKNIKELVDFRNETLAHAKGGIERDPEGRIQEYLNSLKEIQSCMAPLNDIIENEWTSELSEDDVIFEYVEARLLDSMLCPADFRSGALMMYPYLSHQLMSEIEDMNILPDELTPSDIKLLEIFKRGLAVAKSQTMPILIELAHDELIDTLRLQNVQLLYDEGLMSKQLKDSLLINEKSPEIIRLLEAMEINEEGGS